MEIFHFGIFLFNAFKMEIINNIISNYWWAVAIWMFILVYKFFQKSAEEILELEKKLESLNSSLRNLKQVKKYKPKKKDSLLAQQIEKAKIEASLPIIKKSIIDTEFEVKYLEKKIKIKKGLQKINPFKKLYS